jgi:hypothetical protein
MRSLLKSNRAAIEMSIGTIVIVVLAMTMLILGIVLVKNIFSSSGDIVNMADDQIKNQVSKLFGEDKKLVMYPDTRSVEIKVGDVGAFGIGIKNLLSGPASQDAKFTYETIISDPDLRTKCAVTEKEVESWIVTGRSDTNIPIASAEIYAGKVTFNIPEGTAQCTFRVRIDVKANSANYATDFMDITIKA